MAYPDLSDLILRVRDRLNEDTASFYSDAQIKRWLNSGENDVATKSLCYESIQSKSTTSGTRTVAVTAIKVHHVEYIPTGTNLGLVKINPLQLGHLPTDGATPQYWFQWGQVIGIEPKPAAIYSLNLYTSIFPTVALSNNTDEPAIPTEFIPLTVDFAVTCGLLRDNLYSKAAAIYIPYIQELKEIRDKILTRYSNIRSDIKLPDTIKYSI